LLPAVLRVEYLRVAAIVWPHCPGDHEENVVNKGYQAQTPIPQFRADTYKEITALTKRKRETRAARTAEQEAGRVPVPQPPADPMQPTQHGATHTYPGTKLQQPHSAPTYARFQKSIATELFVALCTDDENRVVPEAADAFVHMLKDITHMLDEHV
jgi:hypothetical protein